MANTLTCAWEDLGSILGEIFFFSFFFFLGGIFFWSVPVVLDAPPWVRPVPLAPLDPRVDGRVEAPTMYDTLAGATELLSA